MSTTNEEQKKIDDAVEATFPASDPPANGKDVGPDKLANFDAVTEPQHIVPAVPVAPKP